MWDSLKPDWNGNQIMLIESKINTLNMSRFKSNQKTESDPVKNNGSSKGGNEESNQVEKIELNRVGKY